MKLDNAGLSELLPLKKTIPISLIEVALHNRNYSSLVSLLNIVHQITFPQSNTKQIYKYE